jgi:hypothetical protein
MEKLYATLVIKLLYGESGSIVVNTLPPGEVEILLILAIVVVVIHQEAG